MLSPSTICCGNEWETGRVGEIVGRQKKLNPALRCAHARRTKRRAEKERKEKKYNKTGGAGRSLFGRKHVALHTTPIRSPAVTRLRRDRKFLPECHRCKGLLLLSYIKHRQRHHEVYMCDKATHGFDAMTISTLQFRPGGIQSQTLQ